MAMRVYLWTEVQGVLFPDDPADVAAVLVIARTQGRAQTLLDEECDGAGPPLPLKPTLSRPLAGLPGENIWVFHRATELGD